jgi:ABC-type bacteriocin/lantibiotic exporter with double-glycine peptidase domain
MLKAHGLRYKRAGQVILADTSIAVSAGERVAVTGPSGSGKTSLLALLAGLATPTTGEVSLDGRPLTGVAGPAPRAATARLTCGPAQARRPVGAPRGSR